MSVPPDTKDTDTNVKVDRKLISNPVEIAEHFNRYFTSIFSCDPVESPTQLPSVSGQVLSEISLTSFEVASALRSLNVSKASGPDRITARLLIETSEQIAPSLTLLFNKSLEEGVFPDEWKLANIVPVYKKDNRQYVENYRPISLLIPSSQKF
ncbi:Hypothetical predicted protein [Paramuricea clavata]|uniref:Uncharacterized protein n=1 Tax=Paramuricea clavata TaxID=317549 RepID=A0A6S7GMW5_PARCT|nr:Hypothetical predicted protein [Paramuricea clavata]